MAYNGDGTFSFPFSWANDAANGIPITASRMDTQFANATQGFDDVICRDGQSAITANIPWGGFKITGLGAPTLAGDALGWGYAATFAAIQVDDIEIVGGSLTQRGFYSTLANKVNIGVGINAGYFTQLSGTPIFVFGTAGTSPGGWSGDGIISAQWSGGNVFSGYQTFNGGSAYIARIDNVAATFMKTYFGVTQVGSISGTSTATAYNTSSDARLKENIQDAGDPWAIINALKVRSWDWKSTGDHEAFGFVAQEEVLVYPNAVTAGDSGDTIERQWQRDDSKLVPMLVKMVQILEARLATLEAK